MAEEDEARIRTGKQNHTGTETILSVFAALRKATLTSPSPPPPGRVGPARRPVGFGASSARAVRAVATGAGGCFGDGAGRGRVTERQRVFLFCTRGPLALVEGPEYPNQPSNKCRKTSAGHTGGAATEERLLKLGAVETVQRFLRRPQPSGGQRQDRQALP
ncbi:hypothetical protein PTTG_27913 [Puccinia triticina 1-1 BBBD Race 1]|uniref:Uncharacterized protein n=1 Tax=Puccinia triticina (isolate 1-1 / race 1 (BBBD)) TaxID=630390 RepID=A0A180GI81_PUCT1|nr:hypothetical protein PTTG_27913 [Puccinia triticina 1-1 BBBD Race 1]WAR58639.1 hypothetical protein PtB15_5B874 [Puccinia triticina]